MVSFSDLQDCENECFWIIIQAIEKSKSGICPACEDSKLYLSVIKKE